MWISKPGTTWPAPDFLDTNMRACEQNVLRKFPASDLGEEHAFCTAVGEIQGEFLVIHPFREGNARTIKLAADLLAAQTGPPLLAYDRSDDGQRQYIEATRAAFKRDYAPMIEIIRRASGKPRGGREFFPQPLPRLVRQGGESFDDAVALRHVENPLDPLRLIPEPRIRLCQRGPFSEVCHTSIIPLLPRRPRRWARRMCRRGSKAPQGRSNRRTSGSTVPTGRNRM